MNQQSVLLFDVGFTYDIDGYGPRMVVYTKGCNLHCPWCASPESLSPVPEVLFYPQRLPENRRLAECACPYGAVAVQHETCVRDISVCARCQTYACTHSGLRAFELVGRQVPIEDLIAQARRYQPFLALSGGVTIGGGEPTCQLDAVHALLTGLQAMHIHTALETNGTSERLQDLFAVLDLLLIDFKHPEATQCAALTGQSQARVLENIRVRHAQGGAMIVRIPLAPGYNAEEETMRRFAEHLAAIGALTVEIIPFHRRGEVKWLAHGRKMPAEGIAYEPSPEQLTRMREVLHQYGLVVKE